MALRTGLAGQIGYAAESVWSTPVTVTRFLPLAAPFDGLGMEIEPVISDSIIAGRQTLDSAQWNQGRITAGGPVGHELYDRGLGLLLKACVGGSTITGSDPYTNTLIWGDLAGQSLTIQKGVPDTSGTVRPLVYPGSKVRTWELSVEDGSNAAFNVDFSSKAEYRYLVVTDGATTASDATVTSATAGFSMSDIGCPISGTNIPASSYIASINSATSVELNANATGTGSSISVTIGQALASASYPAGLVPFRYVGGSLTVGGTAVPVKKATVTGDNALSERRFIGGPFISEQYSQDHRGVSGTFDAEFASNSLYDVYRKGTESALVILMSAGTKTITVTVNVRFDGSSPKVEGRGIVAQSVPFVMVGPATDLAALSIVTVNSDSVL